MEGKAKEDSNAVKNDLARIDFDFDFDIDVGAVGINPSSQNYEQETQKILEQQEKMLSLDKKGVKQDRKHLSKDEKEVISEILKSQTDKDITSICEDITKKGDKLSGKDLIKNVLKFLDQIGLFGHQNRIADLDFNFESYIQFAQTKHNLKVDNAHGSVPQFVKAFYEYLLTQH